MPAPTREDRSATGDDQLELDALDAVSARAAFGELAGSSRWVETMVRARPYGSREALIAAAHAAFDVLGEDDWREAFAAHSPIGAPCDNDARGAGEQAGAASATPEQRAALADGNARYEQRFGHVFLIRAAGRGPEEILQALADRLANDPATELRLAADQQREITLWRLAELAGP